LHFGITSAKFILMIRRVNRAVIDWWVLENGPDGVAKLAAASGVSSSMISKIRTGRVPVRPLTRRALAQALDVEESELFPVTAGKSRAS